MKPLQSSIALAMFALLMAACSTGPFNNTRKIASVEIPPACQMNLPNPVTKIVQKRTFNGQNTTIEIPTENVTITCRNGYPQYSVQYYSEQTGNSIFNLNMLPQGTVSSYQSENLGIFAQPPVKQSGATLSSTYTFSTERNAPVGNYNTQLQFNEDGLKKHIEFCAKTHQPILITEPTTHKDEYSCQKRFLPRSPINGLFINGTHIQRKVDFACFDGEPRYRISVKPNQFETETLAFGPSDGNIKSSIFYKRTKTDSGNPQQETLVDNKVKFHSIDVFTSGTIAFSLKDNRKLRVNFDKEMLAKHKEWCAIGQQKQSYAIPQATDGTVAPQQEDAASDIVPLIEN